MRCNFSPFVFRSYLQDFWEQWSLCCVSHRNIVPGCCSGHWWCSCLPSEPDRYFRQQKFDLGVWRTGEIFLQVLLQTETCHWFYKRLLFGVKYSLKPLSNWCHVILLISGSQTFVNEGFMFPCFMSKKKNKSCTILISFNKSFLNAVVKFVLF